LLGIVAAAAGETPESQFQKLYGDDAAKAAKSPACKEAVALAAKLVYNTTHPGSDPGLVSFMLEKAYDLGSKSLPGCPTAILAARMRMDQEPGNQQPWREKLLTACRFAYQKSNGSDKTRAAETLISELMDFVDTLSDAGNFADAVKPLQECRQAAVSVKSPRLEEITDRIKAVNTRIDSDKKFSSYVAKLKENPDSAAMAKAAVMLCMVQRDRPADAVPYAAATGDETLKKLVPLAAQDQGKVSEQIAGELAAWYQPLAKKADRPNKIAILKRVMKYYDRMLAGHSGDAQDSKAKKEFEDLSKELASLVLGGHELALPLGNGVKMRLVRLAAGKFTMGARQSYNQDNRHPVILSKAFYMGATEVTQQQYEAVMGDNPSRFKGPMDPVENVTWKQAMDFCDKLSARCGYVVRLPTDAQREYACRAGSQGSYCFGDQENQLGDYAWYRGNHDEKEEHPHPVGQKRPNAWGLHDMHGNVYEWCSDWFEEWSEGKKFPSTPLTDPTGPTDGDKRLLRGGVWSSETAWNCQSWGRFQSDPTWAREWVGFRIIVETAAAKPPRNQTPTTAPNP
jgi:formylglycine-generating enzyme required for sulfatase activity